MSQPLTDEQVHIHRHLLYMAFHSDRPEWEKQAIAGIAEKSGYDDMADEMHSDLAFEQIDKIIR